MTINLSVINGDAYYRGSAPTANIAGAKAAMSSDLVRPAVTLPGSYTNLGNYSLYCTNTITVDSGNYHVAGLPISNISTGGNARKSASAGWETTPSTSRAA